MTIAARALSSVQDSGDTVLARFIASGDDSGSDKTNPSVPHPELLIATCMCGRKHYRLQVGEN